MRVADFFPRRRILRQLSDRTKGGELGEKSRPRHRESREEACDLARINVRRTSRLEFGRWSISRDILVLRTGLVHRRPHHHHQRIISNRMAHPQSAFAPPQGTVSAFSALNIIWLLHAALEGPVAFIGLFLTRGLAFKDEINNTTAVIIKVSPSFLSLLLWKAYTDKSSSSLRSWVFFAARTSCTQRSRSPSRSSASSSTVFPTTYPASVRVQSCYCSTTVLLHRYCSMPSRLSTLPSQRCWRSTV